MWSILRTAIVAQSTGSTAILRVTMTWTIHYSACCSLPAALNNHSITTCKQLVTAFHQWHNNDVFTFPKRIMTECQLSGCINKSGEGVSKGKKIFKITNATKFPTKRELAIIWLHYIGTGQCGSIEFNTLPAKDGDLRLSASNACLPKTEISVFVTECVFFTSTCYKLHMITLHDVLYS